MPDTDVCLELFVRWLNEGGERFRLSDNENGSAAAAGDGRTIAIEVRPLVGPTDDTKWRAARETLEQTLGEAIPVPIALWLPAGADLPAGEPATSEFIDHVTRAAVKLGPNERSHVPLQVRLLLRKNADTGGVVSATGGLNPHWARFTERVRGSYDLDSTAIHRLPESKEHLDGLIDEIVERSATLQTKQVAEIETIDAWTIQRLSESSHTTILGVPKEDALDLGLAVRRNFRRILTDAGPVLRERDADLRALIVLGPYARIEDEGATTAMRGYDPALYAGLDFVCLIADGIVKPLIQAQLN